MEVGTSSGLTPHGTNIVSAVLEFEPCLHHEEPGGTDDHFVDVFAGHDGLRRARS
jgi:hypothetical protein